MSIKVTLDPHPQLSNPAAPQQGNIVIDGIPCGTWAAAANGAITVTVALFNIAFVGTVEQAVNWIAAAVEKAQVAAKDEIASAVGQAQIAAEDEIARLSLSPLNKNPIVGKIADIRAASTNEADRDKPDGPK